MPVTKYFAPREEAALMLQHCGVPRDIVQLCGIPIVPAFANLTSKAQCREALGALQWLRLLVRPPVRRLQPLLWR